MQARAEEVAGAWRVSDMALANEVERRLGLEGELANTRELLRRCEHSRSFVILMCLFCWFCELVCRCVLFDVEHARV